MKFLVSSGGKWIEEEVFERANLRMEKRSLEEHGEIRLREIGSDKRMKVQPLPSLPTNCSSDVAPAEAEEVGPYSSKQLLSSPMFCFTQKLYRYHDPKILSSRSLYFTPSSSSLHFRGGKEKEMTGFLFLFVAVVKSMIAMCCSFCDRGLSSLQERALCSPAHSSLLDNMSIAQFEEFVNRLAKCHHKEQLAQCLKVQSFQLRIASSLDAHRSILYSQATADTNFCFPVMVGSSKIYEVFACLSMNNIVGYNDWAIVTVTFKNGSRRCRLCLRSKCAHTEAWRQSSLVECVLRESDNHDHLLTSFFPYDRACDSLQLSSDCFSTGKRVLKQCEGSVSLKEQSFLAVLHYCAITSESVRYCRNRNNDIVLTSTDTKMENWSSYVGLCLFSSFGVFQLSFDNDIDGSTNIDHVIRMQGSVFTEELLRMFWSTWIIAPCNYRSFWKSRVYHYQTLSPFSTTVVAYKFFENYRKSFMKAAINFILLCNIDFREGLGGACEGGCMHLLMDGTYGGFESTKCKFIYSWKKTKPDNPAEFAVEHSAGPYFDQRTVDEEELIRLLYRFSKSATVFDKRKKKNVRIQEAGLLFDEYTNLDSRLQHPATSQRLRELDYLLNDPYVEVMKGVTRYFANDSMCTLLECITSIYSVHSYLPEAAFYSLECLLTTYSTVHAMKPPDVEDKNGMHAVLLKEAPILYAFLEAHTCVWTTFIPNEIRRVCDNLLRRSRKILDTWKEAHIDTADVVEDPVDDNYFETGLFYKGMPIVRNLGNYLKDKPYTSGSSCNKDYPKTGRATPGIFKLFCMHCERQVGFHVQKWDESVRTPFEIIFTRWLTAPKILCYDNSCNLSNFCLSREPLWFSKSRFIIDRLHYNGHKNCCPGHSPDENFEIMSKFKTQWCEQSNSCHSQAVRTQTFHMGQHMFLLHMLLHQHFHLMKTFDIRKTD